VHWGVVGHLVQVVEDQQRAGTELREQLAKKRRANLGRSARYSGLSSGSADAALPAVARRRW
jgi:hypothetical protein